MKIFNRCFVAGKGETYPGVACVRLLVSADERKKWTGREMANERKTAGKDGEGKSL